MANNCPVCLMHYKGIICPYCSPDTLFGIEPKTDEPMTNGEVKYSIEEMELIGAVKQMSLIAAYRISAAIEQLQQVHRILWDQKDTGPVKDYTKCNVGVLVEVQTILENTITIFQSLGANQRNLEIITENAAKGDKIDRL